MFLGCGRSRGRSRCFPRIRGDVPDAVGVRARLGTFSPHTRGCSRGTWRIMMDTEVFPAYAGMFLGGGRSIFCRRGFPRIRGDVPGCKPGSGLIGSFSPHTRGCSAHDMEDFAVNYVFPAYAGMFPRPPVWAGKAPCFPRIRGDVPVLPDTFKAVFEFSPHTRGCSPKRTGYLTHFSVFPAYAGMFLPQYLFTCPYQCFPRIRGDVPTLIVSRRCCFLFSPHTRGCSVLGGFTSSDRSVFPAYAGMFLSAAS